MSTSDQLAACLLIAVVLLIQLSSAHNRVVFPEEDYVSTENGFPVTPIRIPERILMQLNNVQSVTDFLKKFVEPEENIIEEKGQSRIISGSGKAVISGRKAAPRGRKTNVNDISAPFAEPAKCKPEWKVEEIQQPADGARLRWPNCIRVKRCGGCCWGSLKACTPLQVSLVNLTVAEAFYDPRDPEHFQNTKQVVISVEHHTKCACKCLQGPGTCGPLQSFDEENCRCVCSNRKLASRCTQHKVWDDSECTCKCREKVECSTGRCFNEDKCKCELMKW